MEKIQESNQVVLPNQSWKELMDHVIVIHQKYDQSIQDYTILFYKQAISFRIPINDHPIFLKYIGGLYESIQK